MSMGLGRRKQPNNVDGAGGGSGGDGGAKAPPGERVAVPDRQTYPPQHAPVPILGRNKGARQIESTTGTATVGGGASSTLNLKAPSGFKISLLKRI